MENYCVYKHIFPNGMIYIGTTKFGEDVNKRWKNGFGYTSNPRMFYDIVQYRWENIEHIVVQDHLTESEAKTLEQELIKEFNTIENGYNFSDINTTMKNRSIQNLNPPIKVQCIETGEIFNSIGEAQRKFNIKRHSGIMSAINKGWTCGKVHWKLLN